jgi:hypothetical protein
MGKLNAKFQSDNEQCIDVTDTEYSNDLAVLRSKIDELADKLQHIAETDVGSRSGNTRLMKEAKRIYDQRRGVDKIFNFEGFSRSPAWDIMLDLFEARCHNKNISVSSAGIGASCPSTTALRWLHALELQGLIARSSDPTDKRRSMISLTNDGYIKTEKALRLHLER